MHIRTLPCALAVMVLCLPAAAGAAEWFLAPQVALRSGYNSNLTITTRPHSAVEELDLIPQVAFGRKTQTTGITGNARFDAQRFWGQSGLNTNDRMFNLHLYDNGERMGWTVDGNITRDTTLQSELKATGLVLQRTPRLSRSLNPSWTYIFSPRTSLNLSYQYEQVRYPNQRTLVLQDYRMDTGTASLTHQYTQRLQLSASGSFTYYRTTRNQLPSHGEFKARYAVVQAGANYAFSQTLQGSLSAGLRRTQTSNEKQDLGFVNFFGSLVPVYGPPTYSQTKSTGTVVNANLQKSWLSSTVNVGFSRKVQPTGYGGLIQTNHLSLSAAHRSSPRLQEQIDVGVYKTNSVSAQANVSSSLNRTFVLIQPAIAWNITRWWQLQGSYRYARQQYQAASQSAVDNAVYVTVTYTWPKIAVSR